MPIKHRFILSALGAVACLWLAAAQAGAPSPNFLGTWEVDVSKNPPASGPAGGPARTPPKSITVTVKDVGGGKWTIDRVTELADGTKRQQLGTPVTIDGRPNPVANNPMFDTIVVTSPDPTTIVITRMKEGKPVVTETSKISADGKQLSFTMDAAVPGANGNPVHATQVWNKK
jgi:hypothetical protein